MPQYEPVPTDDVDDGIQLTAVSSSSSLRSTSALVNEKGRQRPHFNDDQHAPRKRLTMVTLLMFLMFGGALVYMFIGGEEKRPLPKEFVHFPSNVKIEGWFPSPRGGAIEGEWEEAYKKAAELVGKMSILEKVNITTGTGWASGFCVGNTGSAPSVNFPSLCLQDGPLGIRFSHNITAFPAGITVGATWDRTLFRARGQAHAREALAKGIHNLLGPCMGPLGRNPAGGRNWEGFGADPYLQGVAAYETVVGMQGEGIMATAKHFLLNEQEHFRQANEWGLAESVSSNVDPRALREIYAWPFAEAVRAGLVSIMCSYNRVNNTYACGNSYLLNRVLKDEMGFEGFVMSDWLAQKDGVHSVLSGLDMTMPGDGLSWGNGYSLMGERLTEAIVNGSVPLERLDDMATRIVASWYKLGQDKNKALQNEPNFSSWTYEKYGLEHHASGEGPKVVVNHFVPGDPDGKHAELVRKIAAEGTVLLKNEGNILPLTRSKPTISKAGDGKVGIYGLDAGLPHDGPNACVDRGCNQGTLGSGWGSGAVEFPHLVSPIDALTKAFEESKTTVSSILSNKQLIPIRASAQQQDLCIVFINADAGEGYIARDGIRGDRNDLKAHFRGDRLVQEVGKTCGGSGTIVVIHSVGPLVVDDWIEMPEIKAVVMAGLPGQESGNSLVDVLFGEVNPSGKLPYTMGKTEEDYGESARVVYHPSPRRRPEINFVDGSYVDYRWFDKENISPRFPFGFGLSYSTFSLSNLILVAFSDTEPSALPAPRPKSKLTPPAYPAPDPFPKPSDLAYPSGFNRIKKFIYPYLSDPGSVRLGVPYDYPEGYNVTRALSPAGGGLGGNPDLFTELYKVMVELENTGKTKGKEVVQLYVSLPPKGPDGKSSGGNEEGVDFPVRSLRGFEKVELAPGEKKKVVMVLRRKDLSYWDVAKENWVLPLGEFTVWVGTSSRDLPLKIALDTTKTIAMEVVPNSSSSR